MKALLVGLSLLLTSVGFAQVRRLGPPTPVTYTVVTTQTQNATSTGKFYVEGKWMTLFIRVDFTGATANVLEIGPPSGYTFDVSAMPGSSSPYGKLEGGILGFRAGTYRYGGAFLHSSTVIRFAREGGSGLWGNAEPGAPAASDWNLIMVRVPIL